MNLQINMSVCRICMKPEPAIAFVQDQELLKEFEYVTQLKACAGDNLPEKLCKVCRNRLKAAFDFKKLCHASDSHLKKFIEKVNRQFNLLSSFTASTTANSVYLVEEDGDDELSSIQHVDSHTSNSTEIVSKPVTVIPVKSFRDLCPKSNPIATVANTSQPKFEIVGDNSAAANSQVMGDFQDEEEVVSDFNDDAMSSFNEEQVVYILNDGNKTEISSRGGEEGMEVAMSHNQFESDKQVELPKPAVVRVPRSSIKVKAEVPPQVPGGEHVCPKCNNTYSTKTNLQRHLNSHDGQKPYVCPTCGKGFTQNGSLKQHLYIHTGERPYACKMCDRSFTQAKTLTFHMRRHTGEKPYNCLTCGQSFRQRDGLKRHVQIRHSEELSEIFSCSICEKVLNSQTALTNHRKKHEMDGGSSEVSVVYYSSDDMKKEEKKVSA